MRLISNSVRLRSGQQIDAGGRVYLLSICRGVCTAMPVGGGPSIVVDLDRLLVWVALGQVIIVA